jgi:hypothetical protein
VADAVVNPARDTAAWEHFFPREKSGFFAATVILVLLGFSRDFEDDEEDDGNLAASGRSVCAVEFDDLATRAGDADAGDAVAVFLQGHGRLACSGFMRAGR